MPALCARTVALFADLLLGARAAATTMYQPNDPNIYYSPFAWQVTRTAATTANSGSYVRFLFSGTFLNFKFDVSRMVTPASEVYWRVDNGPRTLSLVLGTVSATIPANNTVGTPYHTAELFVKSTTEKANRWKADGWSTRVVLAGVETDGQLARWIPLDVNILIYGDSITEGVRTLVVSQKLDTDHNDASVVYSHALGGLLGAEVGVVGFGFIGLSHGGSGGVPVFGEAWNKLWEGVPRNFTDPWPDLIVLNEGMNDLCDEAAPQCVGSDITKEMTEVLRKLENTCVGVPIAVLGPFNGGQIAHLMAAVEAVGSPNVRFVDTTGFYDMKYGGRLHPTGPNDVARIAPLLANKLRRLLATRILTRDQAIESRL